MNLRTGWLFLLLGLLLPGSVLAQGALHGRILDSETRDGVPFAILVALPERAQTIADLEGNFKMELKEAPQKLRIRAMGYADTTIDISKHNMAKPLVFRLRPEVKEAAVIYAYDPALRIVNNVLKNKRQNNYERFDQYYQKTYSKFVVKPEEVDSTEDLANMPYLHVGLSIKEDSAGVRADSARRALDSFFNISHLFLVESVAETIFKKPESKNHKVLAVKTSGSKDLRWSLLSSQFNDFNIYLDDINTNYLSPIAYRAKDKYRYTIVDTLYTHLPDTVFVINYRPKNKALFNGFEGTLYIHSGQWAVQSVIAKPVSMEANPMEAHILQQFFELKPGVWFPFQVESKYKMGNMDGYGKNLVAVSRSFTVEASVDTTLKRSQFSNVTLSYDKKAVKNADSLLKAARFQELSTQDSGTYSIVGTYLQDSVNLDKYLVVMDVAISGKIPMGPIALDLRKLLVYNQWEGIRPGIGLTNSLQFSQIFDLGVYAGYGFKDKRFKYSAFAGYKSRGPAASTFYVRYDRGVEEFGGLGFRPEIKRDPVEKNRLFAIDSLTYVQRIGASMGRKVLAFGRLELGYSLVEKRFSFNQLVHNEAGGLVDGLQYNEAYAYFRYARGMKVVDLVAANVEVPSNKPVFHFQVSHTAPGYYVNTVEFGRAIARMDYNRQWALYGLTRFIVLAGHTIGNAPLAEQFNMLPARMARRFTVFSDVGFNSMRYNEFISPGFVGFFWSHDFQQHIIKRPTFQVSYAAALGLNNPAEAPRGEQGLLRPMRHPYLEVSIVTYNILTKAYANFGFGLSYRHGAYSYPLWYENFVPSLSFRRTLF